MTSPNNIGDFPSAHSSPTRWALTAQPSFQNSTTAADVQPDTLADRLLGDAFAVDGIVIAPPLVGAWARTPA
jgi:hypothetical protein